MTIGGLPVIDLYPAQIAQAIDTSTPWGTIAFILTTLIGLIWGGKRERDYRQARGDGRTDVAPGTGEVADVSPTSESVIPVSLAQYEKCRSEQANAIGALHGKVDEALLGTARIEGRLGGLENTTGAIRDLLMNEGRSKRASGR